jgi:hypothetical protein
MKDTLVYMYLLMYLPTYLPHTTSLSLVPFFYIPLPCSLFLHPSPFPLPSHFLTPSPLFNLHSSLSPVQSPSLPLPCSIFLPPSPLFHLPTSHSPVPSSYLPLPCSIFLPPSPLFHLPTSLSPVPSSYFFYLPLLVPSSSLSFP